MVPIIGCLPSWSSKKEEVTSDFIVALFGLGSICGLVGDGTFLGTTNLESY